MGAGRGGCCMLRGALGSPDFEKGNIPAPKPSTAPSYAMVGTGACQEPANAITKIV